MMKLLLFAVFRLFQVYLIVAVSFYLALAYLQTGQKKWKLGKWKSLKAVIVTAHPDDECLFFTPTILYLLQEGHCVHLVCLSTGNYYAQGKIRQKELLDSCKILGISEENIKIIDNSALPDHPEIKWRVEDIEKELDQELSYIKPDLIISFDKNGVSGHINHKAIQPAIKKLLKDRHKTYKDVALYSLQSTGTVRGLMSVLDVPYSWWSCNTVIISPLGGIVKTWKAMSAHYSQLLWFRIVYSMFTRYSIVNTLESVEIVDVLK